MRTIDNLRLKIKMYFDKRDILYNHQKLVNLWLQDELGIRDISSEIICYKMFTARPGTLIAKIISKQQNYTGVKQ